MGEESSRLTGYLLYFDGSSARVSGSVAPSQIIFAVKSDLTDPIINSFLYLWRDPAAEVHHARVSALNVTKGLFRFLLPLRPSRSGW